MNVHLFYGGDTAPADLERRALEAYAVARWCEREAKSKYALTPIIAALEDFNLPKIDPTDRIFKALTRMRLQLPDHSPQIGSNLGGDQHYDQVAFFPRAPGQSSAKPASSTLMEQSLRRSGRQKPRRNSAVISATI